MEEKLLTMHESIVFLGISKPTIYRMIRDKSIIAYKVRGRWRFRKDDLDAYLQKNANVNRQR